MNIDALNLNRCNDMSPINPPNAIGIDIPETTNIKSNRHGGRKGKFLFPDRNALIAHLAKNFGVTMNDILKMTCERLHETLNSELNEGTETWNLFVAFYTEARKRNINFPLAFPGEKGKEMKPVSLRLAMEKHLGQTGKTLADIGWSKRPRGRQKSKPVPPPIGKTREEIIASFLSRGKSPEPIAAPEAEVGMVE